MKVEELDFSQIDRMAYIDGEFVRISNDHAIQCLNPSNGEFICEIAQCGEDDVEQAVSSARRAFISGEWSKMAPSNRKNILLKFAKLIELNKEELALLESIDTGKPIRECHNFDLPLAINAMTWHAQAIDKMYGQVAPTAYDKVGMVVNEPLGVVAAITPWNFPLMLAVRKIAPALAVGNSVILKPSEKASLTCLRLAELAESAGVPRGILQVLPGAGGSTGKLLAIHKDVDCLAFTGSTLTGKKIIEYAGRSNMKRTFLECGGKNANIVFEDCYDLDEAAKQAALAAFYNQGEICTAASRVLVEESVKDSFIELLLNHIESMQPGDPLNSDSFMGALIDRDHFDKLISYIQLGVDEGADLLAGGLPLSIDKGGYYIGPTIFDNVSSSMRIFQEEMFGPILTVTGFNSSEEAIALANNSDYGLVSAVWSSDLKKCHQVAKSVRAGSVSINSWLGGDMSVPFGGMKQSGNGRDKSLHAMEKYTETKTIWVNLA